MTAKARCYLDLICNRATIAHFTKEKFNAMPIVTPSIAEQKQITAYLDRRCATIDALIANQQQQIDKLKQYKQAVITEAVTRGLDPSVRMKDSGVEWIGEVPEHWTVSRIGLHFEIILGKMLCNEQVNSTYSREKYFCAADVHFEGLANNEYKSMWFSPEEKERYRVKKGDLLVVEGGAGAGGCAIVHEASEPMYVQNSIMIVRSKSLMNVVYARYVIESLVKRGYIDLVCNKATIPHFTKDKLSNAPLPVLPEDEQTAIISYLDTQCAQIDALIALKQQKADKLVQYKKSLIYEVVTGKREV